MALCNVKSLVYYEHYPNDYVMEHSHNCYECVFYMNGRGVITAGGDALEYDGPTLTVVSPVVKHDEKTQEASKLYIILFEAEDVVIPKQFSYLALSRDEAAVFVDMFRKMQEEEKEKQSYYKDIINSYFSMVLCRFLRDTAADASADAPDAELVKRIKSYMKENYNQDIDFAQIAASFGYSHDRLRHIFKQKTNTTLHQYLLNCRLYAAKQMLLNTQLPIRDIALRCGFRSSIHFSNFFKSRMTISPRQFRRSQEHQIDKGVFKITGDGG